jgi:predicted small lipoprotein YifL
MRIAFIIFTIILLGLASCGKKSPPVYKENAEIRKIIA